MFRRRQRVLTALGLALMATLTACGSSTGPPENRAQMVMHDDESIPAQFDMTYRWIPGPVVEVNGPEGTFVRAFVESFELANAGESLQWGYPGFADAAPSNISQMITVYPPEVSALEPGVGTTFYTALRREDSGDWTRIVLCRYSYQSVRGADSPVWRSRTMPARPVEIDLVRTGATPPVRPNGPGRTSNRNVFGGWYVTRFDFMAIYPIATADQQACDASTPADLPRREPIDQAQPWPTMPPSPGWATAPQV